MTFSGIKAVLFDLDGTLVDTAPDLGGAANHVRATLGMSPLPLTQYRPMASAGARGLLKMALDIKPDHADFPRHRDAFLQNYGDNIARLSQVFAGLAEALASLEQRGVRWGVATNKPSRYTRALLAALGLKPACAISADEVAKPKPAPDMLLAAAEQLRLTTQQCIYVGDDKRDIDAGRAAGMKTVAVEWGYEGEHPIASWNADHQIREPRELLDLLV